MSRLRVESFSISLDGFGAGPEQSLDNPLGIGGESLHDWALATRTFQKLLYGKDEGSTGVDDEFAARGVHDIGAWLMGRNMFTPVRGPWPVERWKGWWGDKPPFHCPVFVLTHHPHPPIEKQGGTTFHFVTGGIYEALHLAKQAAGDKDVRIGGGAATIRQFLRERLIDEMHLAVAPVLLGSGEPLLDGIDLVKLGYVLAQYVPTSNAVHLILQREMRPTVDR